MALDLDALYDEYNAKYFDGGLAKIPVVWGRVGKGNAAEFHPDKMQIVIHLLLRRYGLETYTKMLLLHEMTHVKLRHRRIKDHGKVWVAEMRRLASVGAFDGLW